MSTDHVGGSESVLLVVEGAALDLLTPDEQIELLRDLRWGMGWRTKWTLIEVRLDEKKGKWAGIQECVRSSIEARESCGFRTSKKVDSRNLRGQEAKTTYLGQRGSNGSGRFHKIYDKGQETGVAENPGEWTRWETSFSDTCAEDVAWKLLEAESWSKVAAECVLGGVDFRQVVEGETALARRPRCSWWSQVLDGLEGVRVVARRKLATLGGYRKWLETSVVPGLAKLQKVLDPTQAEFNPRRMAGLMKRLGVGAVEPGRMDRVAAEFERLIRPTWADRVAAVVVDEVAAWRAELIGESFARERKERQCGMVLSG